MLTAEIVRIAYDLRSMGCPGDRAAILAAASFFRDAGFVTTDRVNEIVRTGRLSGSHGLITFEPAVRAFLSGGTAIDSPPQFRPGARLGMGVASRQVDPLSAPCVRLSAVFTASANDVINLAKRGPADLGDLGLGAGPSRACKRLASTLSSSDGGRDWAERARQAAILGSAPRSAREIGSAVACWQAFARDVLHTGPVCMPPTAEGLTAWSALFANKGTFSNYVGKLKAACELMAVPSDALSAEVIGRCKRSIGKRQVACVAPRPAVQHALLVRLMTCAVNEEDIVSAMLYCTAYVFLLRVPSEGLPLIKVSAETAAHQSWHDKARIFVSGSQLVIKLPTRKNALAGSTLARSCWCARCKDTCPNHRLGVWVRDMPDGTMLFSGISQQGVNQALRRRVRSCGVPDAASFSSKVFRRGHARDMVQRGSRIAEILAAGQWRSPQFMKYLDIQELESATVLEAALADESASDVD